MSLVALTIVLAQIAFVGTQRQADEGATAHLWQLLMAGQIPFIAFFAAAYIPKIPREAIPILGLQILAGVAAALPVFLLGW